MSHVTPSLAKTTCRQYFTVPLVVRTDSARKAQTTQNPSTVRTESVRNPNKFRTILVESEQILLGHISQPIFPRRMGGYYKVRGQSEFILSSAALKFFTKCFQNNVQTQGLNSSPLHYRSHDHRACTLYHLSQMVIIMDHLKCYLLDSYY
jgi:hypothetical protein